MTHDADEGATPSATGWDFGAVAWFKSMFNQASQMAYDTTIGVVNRKISDAGIVLTEEQSRALRDHAVTVAKSYVCTVPPEQLRLTADIKIFNRQMGGGELQFEDIHIGEAELHVMNVGDTPEPVTRIRTLSTKVFFDAGDTHIRADIVLRDIACGVHLREVIAAIADCFGWSAARIAGSGGSGGSGEGEEPSVPALRERAFGAIIRRLGTEFGIQVGSIEIDASMVSKGPDGTTMGHFDMEIEDTALGLAVEEGTPELDARTRIDLSGGTSRAAGGLTVMVLAQARGALDTSLGCITIDPLRIELTANGTHDGTPLRVAAGITIARARLAASCSEGELFDCLGAACGTALKATTEEILGSPDAAQLPIGALGRRFTAALMRRLEASLTSELSARLDASIGAARIEVETFEFGDYSLSGELGVSETEAGVALDTGTGELAIEGGTRIDLGGTAKGRVRELSIACEVTAAGQVSLDAASIEIPELRAGITVEGTHEEQPTALDAVIKVRGLSVSAATDRGALLAALTDAVMRALAECYPLAFELPVTREMPLKDRAMLLAELVKGRLVSYVLSSLTARLKAGVDLVDVTVERARYGDFSGSGELKAEDVALELGISPEEAAKIDISADVVMNAALATKDQNLLTVHRLSVALDQNGAGGVTAHLQFHSKGIEAWKGKVAGKGSKMINKNIDLTVPIVDYAIDLSSINLKLHSKLLTWLTGYALRKIKVVVDSGGDPKLVATHKAFRKRVTKDIVGAERLGQMKERGTDAILIDEATAKELFNRKKSKGGVNLQAFLQNNVQAPIDAIRQKLESEALALDEDVGSGARARGSGTGAPDTGSVAPPEAGSRPRMTSEQEARLREEVRAQRALYTNNCLINAITDAAGLPRASEEQLVEIRSTLGNVGEMMAATPRTLPVIARALGIGRPITVHYRGDSIPDRVHPGTGAVIHITHNGRDHFVGGRPDD